MDNSAVTKRPSPFATLEAALDGASREIAGWHGLTYGAETEGFSVYGSPADIEALSAYIGAAEGRSTELDAAATHIAEIEAQRVRLRDLAAEHAREVCDLRGKLTRARAEGLARALGLETQLAAERNRTECLSARTAAAAEALRAAEDLIRKLAREVAEQAELIARLRPEVGTAVLTLDPSSGHVTVAETVPFGSAEWRGLMEAGLEALAAAGGGG